MGMDFLDFFAGIGLFRLGLEQAGYVCKGHCEVDVHANKSYSVMHDVKEGEWFEPDIRKISGKGIPDVDFWTAGFPCQDISMAGNRKGLYGARSGLFFELTRLLKEKGENKPRWVILENVKGLFSSGESRDFGVVLYTMANLGYSIEYALLNSKDYGVQQNRERIFIVCDLAGRSTGKIFPIGQSGSNTLKQLISGPQGGRVYDTSGIAATITSGTGGLGAKTGLYFVAKDKKRDLVCKNLCGTIDAGYYRGLRDNQQRTAIMYSELPRALINPDKARVWQNSRRIKDEEEEMFTINASEIHGILQRSRIRRLTPLETWRLQGVSDEYFYRASQVCSETQLYRQAGNAVTVPVVRAIGEKIKEYLKGEGENT